MYAIVSEFDRCPCGSGNTFGDCCQPIVMASRLAPTAEQLMRSRFTAFATGNDSHLLRTWQRSTRPRTVELDAAIHWVRLDILSTTGGGPFDNDGTVHFLAHYRTAEGRGRQEEVSRFVREHGAWYYVDEVPIAS